MATATPNLPNPFLVHKKYESLHKKHKYAIETINRCRKKILRMHQEKCYLLDRLVKLEAEHEALILKNERKRKREQTAANKEARAKKKAKKEEEGGAVDIDDEDEPPKKRAKKEKKVSGVDNFSHDGKCLGISDGRLCPKEALLGHRYCMMHAPLDLTSQFVYCKFKRTNPGGEESVCMTAIHKSAARINPYCASHQGGVYNPRQVAQPSSAAEQQQQYDDGQGYDEAHHGTQHADAHEGDAYEEGDEEGQSLHAPAEALQMADDEEEEDEEGAEDMDE